MLTDFELRLSIFVLLLCAGCAAPSEPVERKPVVAQKITDLAAAQSGNEVILNFTIPTETVDRRPLTQPLAIEIYRGIGAPGAESQSQMSLLATIPSGEVDQYATRGRVRYVDSLKAEDFAGRNDLASYSVRTRVSAKRDSDPSNVASLQIHPAFEPIADLKAQVTQSAIILTWTPPAKTLTSSTPPVASYHIYRGESATASAQGPTPPLAKIGETESPAFQDMQFQFGRTYVYSVRSVVGSGIEAVDSSDSNLVAITPRDTFPPAAPTGLVVALVPKQAEAPAHFELSWAISPETDVAGYSVYRSEQAGSAGERLNSELLLTPAFRDMNVQPGHHYFYSVAAVDRSGNESLAGDVVSGSVPAENQ
jgi:predicted phage tail protein